MLPLWARIGVTVLSVPSLALFSTALALAMVDDAYSGFALGPLPVLGVASQAGLTIWCAWRNRVASGMRTALLLLSVGAGYVATIMSLAGLSWNWGGSVFAIAANAAMWVAVFTGAAVAWPRAAPSG